MKVNLGSADRRIRAFVVAPLLLVAGILLGPGGWLSVVLYAGAVVMAVTASVSFCPLYVPLRLDTTGRSMSEAGARGVA